MSKEVFLKAALAQIPTILTLLDRNSYSPTYGCFDRNHWHYRIIDFPSGMAQEFVYPLALAYDTSAPDNPYYRRPVLKAWAEAGISYAAHSAHPNGSCDDYFPYEQAAGAAAFSLIACLESYDILKLDRPDLLAFFRKRAKWLGGHDESGQLSNHQALSILALHLAGLILQSTEFEKDRDRLLDRLLDWQRPDGWFPEYEGFDSGYQTITLWCLARLNETLNRDDVDRAVEKTIDLLHWFIHPDGTYGGEYNSRNTYNYFPAGFELAGKRLPQALSFNDQFVRAMARGDAPCYSDDHIIGHHTWNYLLAYRHWVEDRRDSDAAPPLGRLWIKDAGMFVDRIGNDALYIALNKGGVFRFFENGQLALSDTQISARVQAGGKIRTAVGHLVDDYEISVDGNRLSVEGTLSWAKQTQMNSMRLVLLRVVMNTVGRFFPNLIRSVLQRLLIVGAKPAPLKFMRTFERREDGWHVRDEVRANNWIDVTSIGIGGDQTSIYVVMSRTYHPSQMQPWFDLTDRVKALATGESLVLTRQLGRMKTSKGAAA